MECLASFGGWVLSTNASWAAALHNSRGHLLHGKLLSECCFLNDVIEQ